YAALRELEELGDLALFQTQKVQHPRLFRFVEAAGDQLENRSAREAIERCRYRRQRFVRTHRFAAFFVVMVVFLARWLAMTRSESSVVPSSCAASLRCSPRRPRNSGLFNHGLLREFALVQA